MSARGWLPHAACALALLAEAGLAYARRADDAALAQRARRGDADARLAAIVTLANRSAASSRRMPSADELAADPDPRLFELTLTSACLRHLTPEERTRRIEVVREKLRGNDAAATLRAAFLLLNQCDVKAEREQTFPHKEIEWFLAACEGRAPPLDDVRRFLLARYPLARLDRAR